MGSSKRPRSSFICRVLEIHSVINEDHTAVPACRMRVTDWSSRSVVILPASTSAARTFGNEKSSGTCSTPRRTIMCVVEKTSPTPYHAHIHAGVQGQHNSLSWRGCNVVVERQLFNVLPVSHRDARKTKLRGTQIRLDLQGLPYECLFLTSVRRMSVNNTLDA